MAYEVLPLYQVADGSGDPESTAAKALKILEQTRKLNPRLFSPWRNLGTVHTALAELERKRGGDPSPHLIQAYRSGEGAIKTHPNDPSRYLALAEAHLVAARFVASCGRNPGREFAVIRSALARAEAVAPGHRCRANLPRQVQALEPKGERKGADRQVAVFLGGPLVQGVTGSGFNPASGAAQARHWRGIGLKRWGSALPWIRAPD